MVPPLHTAAHTRTRAPAHLHGFAYGFSRYLLIFLQNATRELLMPFRQLFISEYLYHGQPRYFARSCSYANISERALFSPRHLAEAYYYAIFGSHATTTVGQLRAILSRVMAASLPCSHGSSIFIVGHAQIQHSGRNF